MNHKLYIIVISGLFLTYCSYDVLIIDREIGEPKTLSVTEPKKGDTLGLPFTIRFNHSGHDPTHSFFIELNGSEWRNTYYSGVDTVTFLTEGTYLMKLISKDLDDNIVSVSEDISFYVTDSVFTLVVEEGKGSGNYRTGKKVSIASNDKTDSLFHSWQGDFLDQIGDSLLQATYFTMPYSNAKLKATFQPITQYELEVLNGTGSGNYFEGDTIPIIANDPETGLIFSGWSGDTSFVQAPFLTNTYVKMPEKNIKIEASYSQSNRESFNLTVVRGSGSGSYQPGEQVYIRAEDPDLGEKFSIWEGDISSVADRYNPFTRLVMPANNISVTAKYDEQNQYNLTIINGEGDGIYFPSENISIKSDNPLDGKLFRHWTGDIKTIDDLFLDNTNIIMTENDMELVSVFKDSTESASYELDIQPLILLRCARSGCHGPNENHADLTSYNILKENISTVNYFISNDIMPPGENKKLTSNEKSVLLEWIMNDAPKN